jgi:hypothetical protein
MHNLCLLCFTVCRKTEAVILVLRVRKVFPRGYFRTLGKFMTENVHIYVNITEIPELFNFHSLATDFST